MAKNFGAGSLRHVIKVQNRTATRDTFGDKIWTWADESSSIRADVQPSGMAENFSDPLMVSNESKIFTIRYRAGINPKDRIVYASENYNIESIVNDGERNRKLVITASKINT